MSLPDSFGDRSRAHPYQDAAVRRLRDLEYAGVFHEQGLGKTKIGLAIALHWLRESGVDVVLIVTKKMIVPDVVAGSAQAHEARCRPARSASGPPRRCP